MYARAVKGLRLGKKYDIIYIVCVGFYIISRCSAGKSKREELVRIKILNGE